MEQIYLNDPTTLVIPIPESASSDTVTYEIFNSSGGVLSSGSLAFIRDEMWGVSYTPAALGVIILKAFDATTSQKRENVYRVVASSTVVTTPSADVPTTQEILDNVRRAINAKIIGGAVQSYTISGRSVQSYSLKELMDLEKSLVNRVQAESATSSATGGRNYAKFTRK